MSSSSRICIARAVSSQGLIDTMRMTDSVGFLKVENSGDTMISGVIKIEGKRAHKSSSQTCASIRSALVMNAFEGTRTLPKYLSRTWKVFYIRTDWWSPEGSVPRPVGDSQGGFLEVERRKRT